jgi:hypothetical protein
VVLLLALAGGAIIGGLRQIPRATALGQQVETGLQLACGGLSLLVAVTRFRWRSREKLIRGAWAGSLTATAGLSALVWGPPLPPVALLFAGVALLAAGAVLRALGPAGTSWSGRHSVEAGGQRGAVEG